MAGCGKADLELQLQGAQSVLQAAAALHLPPQLIVLLLHAHQLLLQAAMLTLQPPRDVVERECGRQFAVQLARIALVGSSSCAILENGRMTVTTGRLIDSASGSSNFRTCWQPEFLVVALCSESLRWIDMALTLLCTCGTKLELQNRGEGGPMLYLSIF